MKLEELFEARRNPSQNSKKTTMEQFIELGELYGTENIYVTFTKLSKFGANVKSTYNTPIGIYGYPLSYVLDNGGKVPFAGDQPYCTIFKVNSDKLWILTNEVNSNIDIKKRIVGAASTIGIISDTLNPKDRDKNFWHSLYVLISTGRQSVLIRKIFRMAGIDGIIDNGLGIIHINEPTQAIFFDISKLKVIKQINNSLIKDNNVEGLSDLIQKVEYNGGFNNSLMQVFFDIMEHAPRPIRELEPYILLDPDISEVYIDRVIKKRWPKAEPILKTDPGCWARYCQNFKIVESRTMRLEDIITEKKKEKKEKKDKSADVYLNKVIGNTIMKLPCSGELSGTKKIEK